MQIGIVLPHHEIGTDPGAIRAFAQGAENLGFSHLLIYDHVLGADPDRPGGWKNRPYDKDVQFHEPLTTFAFIAAVTQRIEMMTAVLILPQRQTALVAKQAAEVALLSGGRFRLGIGTGWNTIEYEALNEDFATRGRRQAEQVDLLRKLWAEDSLTYQGKYHTVSAASINPRPAQTIPIWFGGAAPALITRCAQLGDGWIPLMGPTPDAAAAIESLKSQRAAAGKSWDGFGIQAQAQIRGGDADRWRGHADKWRALGATHLAVATHNAGLQGVDAQLRAAAGYLTAVTS
ncbi:MAG: LLM class F420-dependent oxidoreductase [Gammaproteobacteria bacterium]|nr:LLM class F420-dependent oxidoreductase [Gammaproteobacteria bacterium]